LGELKINFEGERVCFIELLKKNCFLYQKNLGGHKKLGGVREHPPGTTNLPEIKTITKGALPRNVPHGYGPAWKKYIVLYVKCYVKQWSTELHKPKAIRLYSYLNYLF